MIAKEIQRRYPRLIRASKWVAILCETEALACIRDHKLGSSYSSEAVNHYGGTRAVLSAAWKSRKPAREAYAEASRYKAVG